MADDRHVRLPGIGVIRTKEPTTKLAGLLDAGAGRVLSATVSQQAGRWYVSFTCEVTRPGHRPLPGPGVGVDVGVKSLAVLSSGEVIENPEHLSKYARRMARLQGQCARRAAPVKERASSGRWACSTTRLGRTHSKLAAARSDRLHKLTARLAKTHATVVIEDLGVAAMTASARGSRQRRGKAALEAAPGELRRQLAYKTAWYGSALVVADRWCLFQELSRHKTVKAKLSLSDPDIAAG